MIVEREIAGFTFPYFAALAVTALLTASFSLGQTQFLTHISLLVTSAAAICLIHPDHRQWSPSVIWGLILIAAAGCGCLSSLTFRLSGTALNFRTGNIPENLIGSIPFSDKTTNSLLAALITGDRTGIPKEVTAAFRSSGASHILALSGLHLGIIYGILSKSLLFIGNSLTARRLRSLFIVLSCGMYTLSTGAGASITRAFIFILLNEIAKNTGRHISTASILLAAGFIQLTVSPGSIHDIGFQLSYAAMAGIAFIFPWLKNIWPEGTKGPMKWIWNSAAMSISCQITTGPLAYLYFGTFPQYFLLTNLIALPLTAIIIPSAILTTILHHLGICPDLVIRATEKLTFILRECLEIIASL